MFDDEVLEAATALLAAIKERGGLVTTAESCTGGLIAGALTSIAGASDCFHQGFVTYSNVAKTSLLGLDPFLLSQNGAVSPEVASAMAGGALKRSGAGLALAVTGIAGPGGGSADKPVGLVYIAALKAGKELSPVVERCEFGSIGRDEVRRASVLAALELGLEVWA